MLNHEKCVEITENYRKFAVQLKLNTFILYKTCFNTYYLTSPAAHQSYGYAILLPFD